MKNKFNFRLFLDGMRQLRTIGIVSLVIFCLAGIFSVIGINVGIQSDAMFSYSSSHYTPDMISMYAETFNLYPLHMALFASFLIVVPIMVLNMFGFMNKRNSSDFYHSAPVKRETLALSFLASITAWLLIIVLSSTAIVCVTTLFTPFVSINMYSVFVSVIATITACLCVLGAGFFAMSITGTFFSNFTVSVMILTAPRLIITALVALICELNPLLSYSFESGILDYRLNIVVGSILSMAFGSDSLDMFYPLEHFVPVIYTLVLTIFYFAAGFYAFINRKSEIAAAPAANGKLQLLFRLVPSSLICLIPITLILYSIFYNSSSTLDSLSLFFIILLYVIAVIVYFLYEIISTRKFSNLLKAAKTLWILVVFNVAFIASVIIGYHVTLNDVPDKDDVNYIMVSTHGSYHNGYFANTSAAVRITDKNLISSAVDALSDNVQRAKDKKHSYSSTFTITFNAGGRNIKRRIYFNTSAEYDNFMSLLNKSNEYADAYKNLPEYDRLSNMGFTVLGYKPVSDEDVKEIYESLKNEQKTLNYEDAFRNVSDYSMTSSFGSFDGSYIVKNSNYRYIVYITDLTPKTAQLLIDKVNARNAFNFEEFSAQRSVRLTLYEDGLFDTNTLRLSIESDVYTNMGNAETAETNASKLPLDPNHQKLIDELVRTSDMKITSIDNPIVCVSYRVSDDKTFTRYFYATKEFCDSYHKCFP